MNKEKIFEIEQDFWHEGSEYYKTHFAFDGMFVFPGAAMSKEDGESYNGNITSIYRLEEDEPKMLFHQHTPNPVA